MDRHEFAHSSAPSSQGPQNGKYIIAGVKSLRDIHYSCHIFLFLLTYADTPVLTLEVLVTWSIEVPIAISKSWWGSSCFGCSVNITPFCRVSMSALDRSLFTRFFLLIVLVGAGSIAAQRSRAIGHPSFHDDAPRCPSTVSDTCNSILSPATNLARSSAAF